jgi:PhzF family phenazine biosynthesis protein
MKIEVYHLNAFTRAGNGGNPAGVVLDAAFLSDKKMRYVANKVGFSETAFIQESKLADFKIQFFTPTDEVELCGHATIAAFFLLLEKNRIIEGTYSIETKAGVLDVKVKDGEMYLSQTLPKFEQFIENGEILRSLNIREDDLNLQLPIQIVSTGLRDILIPIKTREKLNSITPNFNEVEEISKKYNVIGYHLFTLDSEPGITAHCRNFAPLYDIPEESATGTSNGALACYLRKYKMVPVSSNTSVFEQGYVMKASSEIKSRVELNEDFKITRIEVGGNAVIINPIHVTI